MSKNKKFKVSEAKTVAHPEKDAIEAPQEQAKTEAVKAVELPVVEVSFADAGNRKMVEVVSAYCMKGADSKKTVIDAAFAYCKKIGFTKNAKDNAITRETVATMITSITRLIGKGTEKRFLKYSVSKTDTEFKWFLKPVDPALAPVVKAPVVEDKKTE